MPDLDEHTNDDLLVISRFKNLRLYSLLKTQKLQYWANLSGLSIGTIIDFASLRSSPFIAIRDRRGRSIKNMDALNQRRFKPSAEKLAETLRVSPEWLFPESLYSLKLPRRIERTYPSPEILTLQQANAEHLLPEPKESLELKMDKDKLRDYMVYLLDHTFSSRYKRHADVIRLRFGLDGSAERTLAEVGEILGVTPERIRQMENKALKFLRHPSRSRKLQPFMLQDGEWKYRWENAFKRGNNA